MVTTKSKSSPTMGARLHCVSRKCIILIIVITVVSTWLWNFNVYHIGSDTHISTGVSGPSRSSHGPDFAFASYYQDNMVLQSEPLRAILWGYGAQDCSVEVSINADKKYSAVVRSGPVGLGVWSVALDPQPAGMKAVITAALQDGGILHTAHIENVLFGDVWICGGQSNMAFPMAHVMNATEELRNVSHYPDIRLFTAYQMTSPKPLYDFERIEQGWSLPTIASTEYFSAVCWLYARHLQDRLGKPIGVISSSYGGTTVETWSSKNALAKCGIEKNVPSPVQRTYIAHNSILWNSMIHPLLNMTIKGVIWYQGESNAKYQWEHYGCSFPAMVQDWRDSWFAGTGFQTEKLFPFGFVQISTAFFEDLPYPLIRWHQTADFGVVPNPALPNTFMAVAMDLPDRHSPYHVIHPRYKQDVAWRLAADALFHVYKIGNGSDAPFPLFAKSDAAQVIIKFSSRDFKLLADTDFEMCCHGSACDVTQISSSANSEWVKSPVLRKYKQSLLLNASTCRGGAKMVRYAWATTPCLFKKCALYSKFDFPSPPFVIHVR